MSHQVWVVDDDRSIRWVLEKALEQADFSVRSFPDASNVLSSMRDDGCPDALITDIRMPGQDGLGLLADIVTDFPQLPVIVMTAHSDLESAVASFETGAFEYLAKPFDVDEAVELAQRAARLNQAETEDGNAETPLLAPQSIVGEAPAMQEVFRAIGRLSRSSVTVLINGESGTGKELIASALHQHSPRSKQPFIAINTAAIPKDLLESELFGHEKGAFTGATSTRKGRFEQANGGTLFLDEIGDMPAELQTRLLRVLAEGQFYRVGGHTPVAVDVRIVAATHQNLEQLVEQGKFREDLFHRLNVIRIHTPALRERSGDIPLLARHFLVLAAQELGVETKELTPLAEQYLASLAWPGNVRQLQNTCRWITVMAAGRSVHVEDLPPELREGVVVTAATTGFSKEAENGDQPDSVVTVMASMSGTSPTASWENALRSWAEQQLATGQDNLLEVAMPTFERIMIEAALAKTQGRRQDAARLLGWGRNTLTRKLKELRLAL